MAFIFDGTAYHTARDEPSRIRRGTLQVGGEGSGHSPFPSCLGWAGAAAAAAPNSLLPMQPNLHPLPQAMGENVLAAIQEYTRVLASDPTAPKAGDGGGSVYFDIWGQFMVRVARAVISKSAARAGTSWPALVACPVRNWRVVLAVPNKARSGPA